MDVHGQVFIYNLQGTVGQVGTCHTAVVVTETECAEGAQAAFEKSCVFPGRSPQVLLHDNKPVYQDKDLRDSVEKSTMMIPATPGHP